MNAFLMEYYVNEVVASNGSLNSHTRILWKIPKIEKIVINMGLGEAKDNSKAIDNGSK